MAADELVKRVDRTPNARLTADGWRLKHQAEAGFAPANQFAASERAKKLRETAYSARVRSTWRRVGLIPPLDHWDEQAGKLIEALVQVREMCANAPDRIEGCWRELSRADQDLKTVPASSVRQFLIEGRVTPVANSAGETKAPVLPVFSGTPKKENEPFGYWLFSRQDLFLKAQAGAGDRRPSPSVRLHMQQHVRQNARTASWSQVEQAALAGNDLGIVQGCEEFFATAPAASDARIMEAREMYQAALVRWFAKGSGELDPTALGHLQRYKQLSASWPKTGNDGGAK